MVLQRLICLMATAIAVLGDVSLSNSSNTPGYASATTTSYDLSYLSDSVQLVTGSQFIVTFPSDQFAITTVTNCIVTINSNPIANAICSVNTSSNQVIFQNLVTTATTPSTLDFKFSSQSAVAASSPILNTYFADSAGNINLQTIISVQLTFTPANFTGCTITSNSNVVGNSSVWTFTLTPLVSVHINQTVSMTLPLWSDSVPSNFINSTANCSATCSNSVGGSSETVTISNAITSQGQSNIVFQITSAKNPTSTAPITLAFAISTQTGTVQQCSTTFNVTTPNILTSVTFSNTNRSISVSNAIIFNAVTSNPLPANAYLRVNTSLSVTYTYVPLRPNKLQKVTTADGTLLLSNLTSASVSSFYPITVGNFTLINPTFSVKGVSVTFSTQVFINGIYYKIDSATINITADPSIIKTTNLSLSNQAINQTSTYNISFITVNTLTGLSTIIVVFPPETSLLSNSTCKSSYITCLVNNTAVTVTTGSALAASTNVSLSISNVLNPMVTSPSSSFQIYTYYTALNELVDQLLTGLTVIANPVKMQNVTVTPGNTIVLAQSVDYTFTLMLTNTLPSNGVISVVFPNQILLQSNLSLKSSSSPCSFSQQTGQQINLTCTSSLNQLNFTLSGVTNPSSTMPTSTFTVQAYFNGYMQQYLSTNLIVTMDTATSINSFTVTSSNTTVSQVANYTFAMKLSAIHYTGDRVILTIPSQISIGSGFQCTVLIGLVAVACAQTASTVIEVTLTFGTFPADYKISFVITGFTNNWLTSPSVIGLNTTTNQTTKYYVESGSAQLTYTPSQLNFSIVHDQNIVLLSNSTIKMAIQQLYSLPNTIDPTKLYLIVYLPSTSFQAFSGVCAVSTGACQNATNANSFNVTGLGLFTAALSLNVIVYTQYFTAGVSDTIIATLFYGSDIIATMGATVSVYCQSPCQKCTAIPTVCLTCLPAPYTNNNTYVSSNNTCATTCPSTTLYNTTTQNCDPCINNCASCSNTTSTCTSCVNNTYLFNSTCVHTCSTQYYINGLVCSACVTPCLSCTNSTNCLSCIDGYNFYQNSCLSVCVDPHTIPINGTCVACSSSCYSCIGDITRCTSCQNGLYLLNNSCVSVCPDQTYVNGSTCSNCVDPCLTCSSPKVCLSCNSSLYFYSNTCLSVCPPGTYGNALGQCANCSSECLTCNQLANNCTSCQSSMYRLNNTCVSNCPAPLYPYQGNCVDCIDPCKTCSNTPNNCTSCLSGYLYDFTCVMSCPQGYYNVGSNGSCLACANNCLSCNSLVACLVCQQPTILLNGICLLECPPATPIIENGTCRACSSECLTCSITASNCTTCPIGLYQLRYTCVSTCPIGTVSDPITNTCTITTYTQAIFFFPFFITLLCFIGLAVVSRCFNSNTALTSAVVSIGSVLQLGCWLYYLSNNLNDKEQITSRPITIILIAIALSTWLILNTAYYIAMAIKAKHDDYFRLWLNATPCNYWMYMLLSHLSLLLSHRLYRLLYCRLFNLHPLSMMFKNSQILFPVTTLFAVLTVIFSELPAIISAILIVHYKQLKDQMFYSCVELIAMSAVMALFTLIDIHKPYDFFNDTEYIRLKKYLEKSRDTQTKQQEETFLDCPALNYESENCIASTGKLNYSKMDGDLMMQQDSSSTINQLNPYDIDADEGDACMPPEPPKKHTRINIFEAVLEQEAEYESEYTEDSLEKELNQQKRERPKSCQGDRPKSLFVDDEIHQENEGSVLPKQAESDTVSMMDEKLLKKRWTRMMKQRKEKARAMYKQQEIQTEDPVMFKQLESVDEEIDATHEQSRVNTLSMKKKRRTVHQNIDDSMKKTAQIYLQRLEVLDDKKYKARRKRERSRRLLQDQLQKQDQQQTRQQQLSQVPSFKHMRDEINLDF